VYVSAIVGTMTAIPLAIKLFGAPGARQLSFLIRKLRPKSLYYLKTA
jgi:hypothetical protein